MPDIVPAPAYPNYAGLLSNLIGNLPNDYRNAQEQQGNIDYVALLRKQTQEAQTPSPLWPGESSQPSAPMQLPPAPAPAPARPSAPTAQPPLQASLSDGAGPPPTLAALVSGVAPDPAKGAQATVFLAKVLNVDPAAPLTPAQVGSAQRVMANLIKPSVGGPAMGGQPQPSGFAGRLNVPPDPAVAGSRAAAAPVGPPQPAAARDIAAKETVAYGGPQRLLTGAEAVAIATGNAPGTGGAAGSPFGLPPAAEAVWQRMVPAESGGKQFNPDGSALTSRTGAIGIAQVEPGTGPTAAKLAGLPWDPARFKNDPNYNLALGRAYFAQQVQTFGSPDLAAAAYNAGPRAVLSAMAKASTRGGSYLDYLPAETRDYVAKVTTGGAPQAGGGAPAQASQPIGPQIPLPAAANGDPQRAILMLRQEAGLRRDRGAPGQAGELDQWADAIAKSTELREVKQGQSLIDPYGRSVYTAPSAFQQRDATNQSRAKEIADAIESGEQPPTTTGLYGAGPAVRAELAQRGFDLTKHMLEYQAAQKQVTSLNGPQQVRFVGLANSVVNTIDEAKELSEQMQLSGIPALNAAELAAYIQTQGNSENGQLATKYVTAVGTLKEEFANLANGGYAPTEPAWKLADQQINGNYGVKQLAASLSEVQRLIKYRLNAMPGMNTVGPGAANPYLPGSGGGQGSAPAAPPSQSAAGPPGRLFKVSSKDQYDALPKGTSYIAPDGSVRTKQ